MGVDYSAVVYIGALLQKSRAMDIFGAKYVTEIEEVCPRDEMLNPLKKNYCSDCGTDLRFNRKISEGIEDLEDLEYLKLIKDNGLEVRLLNGENDDMDIAIIGKQLGKKVWLNNSRKVEEIKEYNDLLNLKEKLSLVGIPDPVKM